MRLLEPGKGTAALRAKALYHAGVLASVQADYPQALQLGETSLALYTLLADQTGQAQAHYLLGVAALYMRSFERAQRFFEASLDLYSSIGDINGVAQVLSELG